MGTVVEINAFGLPSGRLEAAVTAAFAEMERIEQLMSPHLSGSDVARLSVATDATEVAPETAAVIALGLGVARESGGAFDMALGDLKALWGIETAHPRVPAPEEIRQALAAAGPRSLQVRDNTVTKSTPAVTVDLGGIAKGFAVDRAVETLRRAGVAGASVNAGGDIALLGSRGGRPWRIGIQHPRDKEKVLAVLLLEEGAVVTSGDYERFFEAGGNRYHHIFDPGTGYPASASRKTCPTRAR
jgi:thiamine biosynthesis lipoprotein